MVKKRNFRQDLAFGGYAEKKLAALLESFGLKPVKNEDKRALAFWDILVFVSGRQVAFEVKFDMLAKTSRNVAIEYYNPKRNANSGITATNADYWTFVFDKPAEIWVTPVQRLRRYIQENPAVRDVFGGDANSYMKLYNKQQILTNIFERVDNLTKEGFFEALNRRDNNVLR